jgi:hypothetical protein
LCGGQLTVEVFAKHYELHYQQKKIKKGDETLIAQFGCITFHPNCYGDRAKLMPAVKNWWSSGWMRVWFNYKVPVHKSEARRKGVHLLHSQMSSLDYLTEIAHNCMDDDVNDEAFIRATMTICGCDTVEEFLASGMWPLGVILDLGQVEEVEAPSSKVMVPLPEFFCPQGCQRKI